MDKILARQRVDGDLETFEMLVRRYHRPILNHLEFLLKSSARAEDFAQEAFLKLLRQFEEESVPLNTRAWLYQVANNLCRDYWRSAGYKKERQILDRIPEAATQRGQVIDIFVRRESRSEMKNLLKELPESQRQIIILRFYDCLKLREIASTLACPVGTVKSRLFHALRFLKGRLEEERFVSYG